MARIIVFFRNCSYPIIRSKSTNCTSVERRWNITIFDIFISLKYNIDNFFVLAFSSNHFHVLKYHRIQHSYSTLKNINFSFGFFKVFSSIFDIFQFTILTCLYMKKMDVTNNLEIFFNLLVIKNTKKNISFNFQHVRLPIFLCTY